MADVSSPADLLSERDFVFLLISLYRDYPELWKVKSKDYMNKNKRSLALQNMLSALRKYKPDYNEDKLKKKINILRTNFNKEFRKIDQIQRSGASSDVIPESTLWYYNDLIFIKDQEESAETKISEQSLIEEARRLTAIQTSLPPPKKMKSRPNSASVDLVSSYFERRETEIDILAKFWAMKLNRLAPDQRRYAEKIINDTLFEGAMGTLTRKGVCFNTPSTSPVKSVSLAQISAMASNTVEYATVQVAQGILRGKKVVKNNGAFYNFQGIPYAKPPVGALRFKPPQPAEPWKGTRDALKEGPSSAQIDFILKSSYLGEEDCLYLNVYTPKLPEGNKKSKIPVMVFIHGGGFVGGSGNTDLYGPSYLVQEVVLVTINYRLGALGFLSLADASVPGNNGLKDQVAALRWIKQNISSFNGDPDNVTIFGESAGGASVNFHVLSPMSKGLFHKAIAQSGCVLNPWAMCTPEQARERAFRLGKTLGYNATNQKDLLQFLQTANVRDIVEASPKMMTEEEKKSFTLAFFLPIVEENVGEETFLPANPLSLMKEGKFNHVPYMTGITDSEGIVLMSELLKQPEHIKSISENYKYLLPAEIRHKVNAKESITQIKKHYYGGENLHESHFPQLVNFYTHTWFLLGIHKVVNFIASKSSQPVYYYLFEFDGELNFYKKFLKAESLPGASHIDDLGYLFRMDVMDKDVPPQSSSYKVLQKMIKLWTNFAKTGNPTPILDSDITMAWPQITPSSGKYFRINNELSVDENLMTNDVNFWSKIL